LGWRLRVVLAWGAPVYGVVTSAGCAPVEALALLLVLYIDTVNHRFGVVQASN